MKCANVGCVSESVNIFCSQNCVMNSFMRLLQEKELLLKEKNAFIEEHLKLNKALIEKEARVISQYNYIENLRENIRILKREIKALKNHIEVSE